MRRQNPLEPAMAAENRRHPQDDRHGNVLQRMSGDADEFHISSPHAKDSIVTADDGSFFQGSHHEHVKMVPHRVTSSNVVMADNAAGMSAPMFFQEGSSTHSAHGGDKPSAKAAAPPAAQGSKPSTGDSGFEVTSREEITGIAESKTDADASEGKVPDRSAPEEQDSVTVGEDVARRAAAVQNVKNSLMQSVTSFASLNSDEANAKADSLGGLEDEANYSLDTEGFWLLSCMGGLLFFSCVMICAQRLSAMCACARPLQRGKDGQVLAEEETVSSEGKTDSDGDVDLKVLVPPFQAVINSAREKNVLGEALLSPRKDSEDEQASASDASSKGVDEGSGRSKAVKAGQVPILPPKAAEKPHDSPIPSAVGVAVPLAGTAADASEGVLPRARVKDIASFSEAELEKLESAGEHGGGYDCALARPLSVCQIVRLQTTILPPQNGEMVAPLALQMCVLYQVTVSRRLHAGMPPVPVAFSSMSTAFHVAPCDRPNLRIVVEGSDVMLFDTVVGYFSHKGTFANAPGHLQDYVLTHRSAVPGGQWQTSSDFRKEASPLEFQECALLVGAKATVVGELARDAGGELVLRPAYLGPLELSDAPRVLVSDDPQLSD